MAEMLYKRLGEAERRRRQEEKADEREERNRRGDSVIKKLRQTKAGMVETDTHLHENIIQLSRTD